MRFNAGRLTEKQVRQNSANSIEKRNLAVSVPPAEPARQSIQQTLFGEVVSDAGSKTIVVRVKRQHTHPKYPKQVSKMKKYYAHDQNEEARVGDIVEIRACRPLSRMKRWELVGIVQSSRDRRTLWASLQLVLSARIRSNPEESERAKRSFVLVLSLQPRQTALFAGKEQQGASTEKQAASGPALVPGQQSLVSKRPVQAVIQLTGKGVTKIQPSQIKISYSVRYKTSTEELVNIEIADDHLPFIQAAILLDRTLVEVKRFALVDVIAGVEHGS